jgi:predicted ATP-grasp superfamily ATP-dependent carboligase
MLTARRRFVLTLSERNMMGNPMSTSDLKLNHPWLVAAWPGIGHVAISAAYYLMAKLGMHQFAEFSARELFDIEAVTVEKGLIQPARLPRSRIFVWKDPAEKRDIVVFIGEAQPPTGRYAFCQRLVEFARELGIEKVVTFAAMATHMRPSASSRVFAAATDTATLDEVRAHHAEILEEGHIGGLNGVFVGAAAEQGIHGLCLLGESPQLFAQIPFPKASLAVIKVFGSISGVQVDLAELETQASAMEKQLEGLLKQVESQMEKQDQAEQDHDEEDEFGLWSNKEEEQTLRLSLDDEKQIEELFGRAKQDRSKAYELKRELDRLGVFAEYEDRFLDLFKSPN